MFSDFFVIFYWWLLFLLIGTIFLPLAYLFFKNFFDCGYIFSKILGVLLFSFLVWVFGSLKILPLSSFTLWFTLFLLAAGNLLLAKKALPELKEEIKKHQRVFLFEELGFFVALLFWSYIRGFQPDIEGLEKFMDYGFINSILRGQYFPPADMWMAGKTINYYYFGHLVAAVLTKFSTLDSAITYNLMLATIFALTSLASFSLVGNLISTLPSPKKMILTPIKLIVTGAVISAVLLTLGGNLHTLWWFLTHNLNFTGYWYPDATRFIVEKFGAADNTIHEFPIYSFVVSDLHGHVSDIPFVFLTLALLFSFLKSQNNKNNLLGYILILSLCLAAMYMTNSWDFPIYFLVLGATVLYSNYLKYGLKTDTLIQTFIFTGSCVVLAIIFSLPFQLNFTQIAKGIAPVNAHSPFWQLLVLWGYQWAVGLIFIGFLFLKKLISRHPLTPTDVYVLILLAVATFLIIIPEFFYVKDIYIPSYHRANTVFKLVYQSFMLYALVSGYIVIRVLTGIGQKLLKLLVFSFFVFIFSFVLYYPFLAIPSYYGLKTYRGLWGLSFLSQSFPDNFAAVEWLKKNVVNQPAIVEAVGDSYTSYNQISMATGLPTIEGWLVHEWLWRGSFDEPGKRAGEVQTIYETKDADQAYILLKKYDVKYVFVGNLERQKYKLSEEKFSKIGKIIFEQEDTKIYLLQ